MISPDNLVVQGFWTGPFTTMEWLCAKSFMANGHEFHLYSYEPIEGVPDGVVLKDACEIVPQSEVATFRCASSIFRSLPRGVVVEEGRLVFGHGQLPVGPS